MRKSQILVNLRDIRLKPLCLAVASDGLIEPALFHKDTSQINMGSDMIGLELQGAPMMRRCLGEFV
jgi:hypothetical protein